MNKTVLAFIGVLFFLTGCIAPYRVDIQQGNIVEKRCLSDLRAGLSKEQVIAVLGEPILDTVLDDDRWFYVYTKQVNGKEITRERLELRFQEDKLVFISPFISL